MNAFCIMKYEAKNVSPVATSQANGTPWVSISQTAAISTAAAACDGCHLITEAEWLTIAQNVMSVGSNWSGGSVGSGSMYRGHTDNAPANSLAASTDNDGYSGTGQTTGEQRRTLTLTNGEVIWDFAGNVWEWTSGTTEGGNQPGASGYAWRNWNALTALGSLSPNPHPSYAIPAASSWGGDQNIGLIYSNSADVSNIAFVRGGQWANGANAGVLALSLSYSASSIMYSYVGFRVAR
jgi:formylglycine-generating enzyme required for sulfatase activity